MKRKARMTKHAYLYISEGIILFLIMLFATQFSAAMEAPYWSYLGILFSSMVIFSLAAYFQLNLIIYLLGFTFLIFMFYSNDFSLSLTLIFSIVLTYRYLRLNQTDVHKDETLYIGTAAIFAALLFIIIRDTEIIWFLLIQYAVIFFGYWLVHFMMISKEEQTGFGKSFCLLIASFTVLSTAAFIFLTKVFQPLLGFVWEGIGRVTILVSTFFARLFQKIKPQETPLLDEEMASVLPPEQESELRSSIIEYIKDFVNSYLFISLLIITVLLFFLLLLVRRKKRDKEVEEKEQRLTTEITEMRGPAFQMSGKGLRRLFKKPAHPVRKLVYQFEKKLAKTEYARKSFETIEKWLARISRGSELQIYQQVRYGNQDVSASEISTLKSELSELEKIIYKEKDNRRI